MNDLDLEQLVARLAAIGLDSWTGLPTAVGIDCADGYATELGLDRADAVLVHLDDPHDGSSARAWARADVAVLLEVSWRTGPPPWPTDGLPDNAVRDDVADGLIVVEAGEWLYADRGLAVVTSADGRAVRHVFGFTPTTPERYRRELRPDLATVRRPAARTIGGDLP